MFWLYTRGIAHQVNELVGGIAGCYGSLAVDTVHKQQIKIENIQAQSSEMSVVYKFTSFNQHKTLRDKIYSPVFYSKGYKMCISVYANGNGDGINTLMCLYTLWKERMTNACRGFLLEK